jgi:hypothetical protein
VHYSIDKVFHHLVINIAPFILIIWSVRCDKISLSMCGRDVTICFTGSYMVLLQDGNLEANGGVMIRLKRRVKVFLKIGFVSLLNWTERKTKFTFFRLKATIF